ncbi:MAG: Flp pilus assembly complex ATPase component TadA [Phycisphaerales bacterium]|nr:Flp pilus assembly complex ATPase component TadA [Phycisphaerales bacterium]
MHSILFEPTLAAISPYFSFFKIIAFLLVFIAWAFAAQWVDRDADRVKTKREMWNSVVLAGGLGGVAIMLIFPWKLNAYYLGLAFWIILAGGTLIAYVVHRNGRLAPNNHVMTIGHFKRVIASLKGNKEKKTDKGIRVKLIGPDKKPIEKPTDPVEADEFDATQDLLFDLMWKRASDADIVIGDDGVRVIYKIDGVVFEQEGVLTRETADQAMAFLKRACGLNVDEKRRPQTGSLSAGLLGGGQKPGGLEVRTSGSIKGERLRLKTSRTGTLLKPEELGFDEKRLAKFQEVLALDTGLVLFAGPAESGISTTQYATLRSHDAYLQNIYSLETNPMMKLDNITQQKHGGASDDVSYARALQTVLRREPDIVMVDQCEDRETAQIATRAAREKKIYMTMRASSTFDAIARLIALVEDPKPVAEVLVAVVGQRLLRVLCNACREAYQPDEQLLRKANLPVDKIEHFYRPPSEPILDKKGREIICQTCQNSRYVGRTGVFELLVISDALRKLIASGATANQIKSQARSEKMRYLQEEGLLKVIAGQTSMAEVMRGLRVDSK